MPRGNRGGGREDGLGGGRGRGQSIGNHEGKRLGGGYGNRTGPQNETGPNGGTPYCVKYEPKK